MQLARVNILRIGYGLVSKLNQPDSFYSLVIGPRCMELKSKPDSVCSLLCISTLFRSADSLITNIFDTIRLIGYTI